MSKRLKILFAGLGSIGQRHVRNLRTLLGNEVEILAYRQMRGTPVLNADMTVRSGTDVESTYNIESFWNLDEALEKKPDAVFVTNPNTLHVPVATRAAEAGCHLFIEKPLSHSLQDIDRLTEVVDSNNLVAFVGYQFRFHPGLRMVKSTLEEKRLGRLVAGHIVNAEYLPNWHPYEDYRQSHAARKALGGGCLSIQTHELDYALWLFGMPKRVFAVGGKLSDLELDVEDSVSLLLSCESDKRPLPVHIHLDFLQRPPQRVCEVVGDHGSVRYDYYQGTVTWFHSDGETHETTTFEHFNRNEMFLDEMRHFLACIRGEAKPLVDLQEATRSLRIALAAQQAIACGETQLLSRNGSGEMQLVGK